MGKGREGGLEKWFTRRERVKKNREGEQGERGWIRVGQGGWTRAGQGGLN